MAGPLLASLARSTVISCTRQAVLAMRISLPPSPSNYLAASRQFKTSSIVLMEYDKTIYEATVYDDSRKYYIDLKQGSDKYVKISGISGKESNHYDRLAVLAHVHLQADGGREWGKGWHP